MFGNDQKKVPLSQSLDKSPERDPGDQIVTKHNLPVKATLINESFRVGFNQQMRAERFPRSGGRKGSILSRQRSSGKSPGATVGTRDMKACGSTAG